MPLCGLSLVLGGPASPIPHAGPAYPEGPYPLCVRMPAASAASGPVLRGPEKVGPQRAGQLPPRSLAEGPHKCFDKPCWFNLCLLCPAGGGR